MKELIESKELVESDGVIIIVVHRNHAYFNKQANLIHDIFNFETACPFDILFQCLH